MQGHVLILHIQVRAREAKLSLMSKKQISELLVLAKKYKCVEALFVTGEQPEQRYQEARDWLKENGFKPRLNT